MQINSSYDLAVLPNLPMSGDWLLALWAIDCSGSAADPEPLHFLVESTRIRLAVARDFLALA